MSRITNDDPIKRGTSLTSSNMNQQFTDVNDAFPMDGTNLHHEAIDQPALSLSNSSGKSGIILRYTGSNNETSPVVVSPNTSTTSPFDPPSTLHTFTTSAIAYEDDIIRVYWQLNHEVESSAYNTPFGSNPNLTAWAVYLEWDITGGGAYELVPNQSDFTDLLDTGISGARVANTYATTFIPHAVISEKSSTTRYNPPVGDAWDRTSYGQFYYKADQQYVIYGFRLRVIGFVQNSYSTTLSENVFVLVDATASTYTLTVDSSNISYLIMRSQ